MRWGFLLIFVFSLHTLAITQSKSVLEQERIKKEEEIKSIGDRLKKTKVNRKEALNNYLSLQNKIQKRAELISTLEKEKNLIIKRFNRTTEVIESLEEDTKVLEKEFGTILRQALRQNLTDSYISFIFSAEDFNDAMRRWRYLNQYRSYRSRQAQLIKETKSSLLKKQKKMNLLTEEKDAVIAAQLYQKEQLDIESEKRNDMYQNLKKDEQKLRTDLKDQKEVAYQLKNAILDLIGNTPVGNTPKSETELTAEFTAAKANLTSPVENGLVIRKFGKQAHPTIKRLEINNNGIDILTNGSSSVYASFQGEVVGQFALPNGKKSILVRHGDFYTVYSNLDQAYVYKGDQIQARQEIGDLGPTENTLHYELWRRKVKLNPLDWLLPF